MSVGTKRMEFCNRFNAVEVADALEALKDHLGLSWPELETVLRRGDVKGLLEKHDAQVRLNVSMYGRMMK